MIYKGSVFTGVEGAWIGGFGGLVHGCLLGLLILLRRQGLRLVCGTALSIIGNALWSAWTGHEIVQIMRSVRIDGADWVRVVGEFALMGSCGGAVGGLLLAAGLGWLRSRWPWLTRWDADREKRHE
jgi:hypothetical protein